MNKKNLIDYCKTLKEDKNRFINCIDVDRIINTIKQLDEPEKVKVPQFVTEHIEWTKEEDFHLLGAMNRENFDKKLEDWFYTDDNMELFARAWLDGYEVEKEKRYTVVMKGFSSLFRHLKYNLLTEKWYMGNDTEDKNVKKIHTHKELEEAGFGWVFDCEGIEIKEVEKELNNDQ